MNYFYNTMNLTRKGKVDVYKCDKKYGMLFCYYK